MLFRSGANVTVNATTVFVGNSSVNTAITGTGITLTGNLTSAGLTTSDDVIVSANKLIRRSTSDGSDNGYISLCGGGGFGNSRGGTITALGNENAGSPTSFTPAGGIECLMGNVSGAQFNVGGGSSPTAWLGVSGSDGSTTFTSSASTAWMYNTTYATGAKFAYYRSGTQYGSWGDASQSTGQGSADDFGIGASVNNLYLEAPNAKTVNSIRIKNTTTASAANMFIDSTTGAMQRSTSSRRYKDEIADLGQEYGLAAIRKLRPVTFVGKTDPRGSLGKWRHFGFIAEEMDEVMPKIGRAHV